MAVAAVALAACESVKYQTKATPDIDFSKYESFSFLPLPEVIRGVNPEEITAAGKFAQQIIKADLVAKGYTYTDRESADAVINITGSVVPKVLVSQHGYSPMDVNTGFDGYGNTVSYYNVADYFGTDIEVKDKGTLMLEFYDNETKEVIWVGWGTGKAAAGGPRVDKVKESVEGILKYIPAM